MAPRRCSILEWFRKLQHGKINGLKLVLHDNLIPIHRLPPELVQYLARNFLEPFESSLLTLCNKRFCYILGTQYWQMCHDDFEQRNKLLSVLEVYFPEKVHCVICAKLHRATSRPYANPAWNCQSLERHIRPYDDYNPMKFIYIQAAIKRDRLGLDIKQYIQFLRRPIVFFNLNNASSEYSKARIISGELIVRLQQWNIYPAEVLTTKSSDSQTFLDYSGCFHFDDGSLNSQIRKLFNNFVDDPNHSGGLRQCRFCYTDFQLDMMPFFDFTLERPGNLRLYDRYIAIVKTAWINFGDGNPDLSGKYRTQFVDEWQDPHVSHSPVHNPVVFEPGSIKDAFEHGKKFYFQRVVSRKEKRLMKTLLIQKNERLVRHKNEKLVREGREILQDPFFAF